MAVPAHPRGDPRTEEALQVDVHDRQGSLSRQLVLVHRDGEQGHAAADVELVAHSTTQATNALLEGDVAPVLRYVILPPGEGWLAKRSLKGATLDLGGGHALAIETRYIDWQDADAFSQLKGRLAKEFHNDVPSYVEGKDAFLKKKTQSAMKWKDSIVW